MKRLLFVMSLGLIGSIATFAACKQGRGERCQTNADCDTADNLVCNQATSTCESTSGAGDLDAGVIDAVPGDAAPDAAADASVDAMPDAP